MRLVAGLLSSLVLSVVVVGAEHLAAEEAKLARAGLDLGRVEDSFAADRLYLILKRPVERERELDGLLRDAHTPGAAGYHQWLTPAEFGQRFGAADSDIAAVTAWLESHGFRVEKVHPGRIAIEFSGNAGQIAEAFHTEIHRYRVERNGLAGERFANVSEPQVPAALGALVAGVSPMHSVHARPLIKVTGKTIYNVKTHKAKPAWTYPEGGNAITFELSPADFAVQYGLGPVYAAGTKGAGQSIGILSDSNIDLSLVQAYQGLFGLQANLPTVVVDGNDPGQTEGATEAYLDVELSGAVAPAAKVVLYTSAGTVLTDPVLISGLRALEDNQVSVMSLSYSSCEAALGASGNLLWAKLWQEAAAQGITGFVAAGDAGAAACDDFDVQSFAVGGLAVNGLGSTPYNVSVGGTDFYYSDYAVGGSALSGQIARYWSNTASATATTSLLEPVPEQVWNDAFGLNANDGGVFSLANSTIVAGSGGASAAAVYSGAGSATGYAKPAWQTGTGVPADRVRDVPDLSLYAADGANYVYYPICALPGDCVNVAAGGAVYITSVGGTSASAPTMAGIQALVDEATNSRQGQADTVYYALATKTASATAKPFTDIAVGGNQVPCYQGTLTCVLGTSGQTKGFYAEVAYLSGPGYDRATGLGTVNVANLIKDWGLVTFRPTTTTLSVSATSFTHGTAVSVKATVAPAAGGGVPTGTVGLNSNDAVAYSNGLGAFALVGGTVTAAVANLPGGTYQLIADYSGDGSYGASASAPVTVTVTPESDTLNTSGWVLNPTDGQLYPLQAGMYLPYGSEIFLDAQPVGVNEAKSPTGQNAPATGAVVFTDKVGAAVVRSATVPLSGVGVAEWTPGTLTIGTHTVGASYAGDASYAASAQASAASMTVFRGTTTMYVYPLETNVKAGSSVAVYVEVFSDYLPLVGALPTGNIAVTLGNQTVISALKSWTFGNASGTGSKPVQDAVVTFTNVPEGILPLTATFAGDVNWNGSSALNGPVTSLAVSPAPAVTLTASATTFSPNGVVTMTGTVTGPARGAVPSGLLYFSWEDGNSIATGLLEKTAANAAAYTLTFPANELANGSNLVVATFKGDANYSAQSSVPLLLTLNGADFSLTTTTQEVPVKIGASGLGFAVIAPIGAYSGTVTVGCSGPTGITCTPVSAAPPVGSGVVDGVTFKVAGNVAAGVYPAVVTVSGGGHVHTLQILVAAHN
jgi:hypothetical protein